MGGSLAGVGGLSEGEWCRLGTGVRCGAGAGELPRASICCEPVMTWRSAPGLVGRLQTSGNVQKRGRLNVDFLDLVSGHASNGAVSGWRRLPDLGSENGRFWDAATQGLKIGTTAP